MQSDPVDPNVGLQMHPAFRHGAPANGTGASALLPVSAQVPHHSQCLGHGVYLAARSFRTAALSASVEAEHTLPQKAIQQVSPVLTINRSPLASRVCFSIAYATTL